MVAQQYTGNSKEAPHGRVSNAQEFIQSKSSFAESSVCNRYLVAILSNQGGISLKSDPKSVKSDMKRLADFKGKVSAVLTQLELPISVYAATSRDQYRKPRTGMWQELLDDHDLENEDSVDLSNSFFVGDAGGREATASGAVKDHSCVDRLVHLPSSHRWLSHVELLRDFATNVGLQYHTPEEYFLHEDPRPYTRSFDPLLYKPVWDEASRDASPCKCGEPALRDFVLPYADVSSAAVIAKPETAEIVLLCGSPGAGKSSYYWRNLQPLGYGRVNQDILKTVRMHASKIHIAE